uniref:Uncharacterized protein n=1 Tax=Vitis vinifera TaxID=29760 RepID=F6H0Y4_VITVI
MRIILSICDSLILFHASAFVTGGPGIPAVGGTHHCMGQRKAGCGIGYGR